MSSPQRRNLLAGLERAATPVPEKEIVEAAKRHGFSTGEGDVRASPPAVPANAQAPARRQRQPTGRDHPFSVRLRADTHAAIYAEANGRNIPVAQVIEEAVAALMANRRS
jgi:hypothetical protein